MHVLLLSSRWFILFFLPILCHGRIVQFLHGFQSKEFYAVCNGTARSIRFKIKASNYFFFSKYANNLYVLNFFIIILYKFEKSIIRIRHDCFSILIILMTLSFHFLPWQYAGKCGSVNVKSNLVF